MVDINLIGDDQDKFDDESDKDFRESYESDSNVLDQSSYMKGGGIGNQDYAKVIRRGGSKAGVYFLFFVVIALIATTAYFIFKPGKLPKQVQTELISLPDSAIVRDTSKTALTPSDGLEIPFSTESIASELKEIMVKSQVGINTVEQIVNTIPANVDFTMITYSDGKFLSEILAKQSSDIENVGRLLGQKFTTADVKILSRDTRNVKGIQYHQALINGSLDQKEATSAIKPVQQPRFLTAEQFQQRIKAICQESGLTIKQFDVGAEKSEATLSIQPIKFRAFGLKANATNLLRQILEENLNVSLSKISLIANDVDVSNPYNTLVINIGLFKE